MGTDRGGERPRFEERDSADAGFPRDEQMFDFEARKLLLAMGKDDRVDSFAATDATPIERREFEYPFGDHQPSTSMAPVC
jgi:hypothetical protein